ncbi:putative transcription factor interactor and regulator CCHC(Zn) family [Helianthus annuus]|uniref:Transcription factor interactor and regulator CCHC(Zn) family n=1 Tax=Helianthus annuus TaxID=4232 RepID=A0A9K3MYV7_HELAN|nr:putative transcription factor interactor and regulator CCHC(Zn) family [Helianthus annuus]KAJ0516350.1 putative transcription factor interactor and regulator CCHC(Zn) family [Helianthus annuus]
MANNNLTTMVQNLKHNAEVGSSDKPPLLINELDFPEWKERFERYVRAKDIKIWLCIVKGCGATPVRTLTIDTYLALTDDQKKFYDCEEKAMSMITMAMTQSILHTFRKRNSSKELWDSMIQRYEGNEMYKKRHLERLKTQFVVFKALKNESFDDTVNRFYHLLSELDRSKEGIYTEFEKGVLYEELTLEEAVQKLRGYAWNMEDQASDFEKIQDPQLYKASKPTDKGSNGGVGVALYSENEGPASEHAFISNNVSSNGTTNSNQGMYSSSGAQKSQGTSVNIPKIDASGLKLIEENMGLLASFMTAYENFCLGKLVEPSSLDEDFDQIDQDEMEELDLQLNMALLVRRAKKFLLKTGKKFIGGQTKTRMGVDMSKVKCYNCGIYGHFARDCRKPKMERSDRDNNSRGNNSRPQNNASNAASNSSARSSGFENLTPSTNNAMVAQPLQNVTEPYDWGCALEYISGAIVSQAFIAEIVNEEVCVEVVKETSIEELAVVAEVLGEELDSGNVTENESPSIEETVEKPSKTEDGEKGERFEFNISTAEMQQFADAEAKRLEENSVENEACAFMAGIEVKSSSVDKRCARCVEFVTKIDRYAFHNTNLIADLEKSRELIAVLSNSDKEHRIKIKALKNDISEFEKLVAVGNLRNQELKSELEMNQNCVLEKNKIILEKDNLILDLQRKIEKFRDSSEVMNFCLNSQRLKESEEGMFGIGYNKVPPPVNHNYTSMPSIDPELANFVPTTPLTVEPQSESESEPDEVTDSDQSKKSGISKKNEVNLENIENLISNKILEIFNQVQNEKSKPKSRGKNKKALKNVPKTEFVKGEDFIKEEVKIETGSNSQFVNQILKNSTNASSSSTDHEERPKNAAKIRKCYKCRGKGHLAADCPDDRGKSLVDPDQKKPFVDKPQNESVNVEKKNGKNQKVEKNKVNKQEVNQLLNQMLNLNKIRIKKRNPLLLTVGTDQKMCLKDMILVRKPLTDDKIMSPFKELRMTNVLEVRTTTMLDLMHRTDS